MQSHLWTHCSEFVQVRKAVREAVMIILRGSDIVRDGTVEVHPAASITQKYCMENIHKLLNNSLIQKSKGRLCASGCMCPRSTRVSQ